MNNLLVTLKKYLPESDADSAVSFSADEIVDRIKRAFCASHGRRLTNYYPGEEFSIGTVRASFVYKRDALHIHPDTVAEKILGIYDFDGEKKIFLTNSGQVALFSAMAWYRFNLRETSLKTISALYVGAMESAAKLGIGFKTSGACRGMWICSSGFPVNGMDQIRSVVSEHEIFFIDTTCWGLDSPILRELLSILSEKTIFLMRSVSKLDMGGIEYGSLGSLILLGTDLSELIPQIEKTLKITGAAPGLDDIPPYLFDLEYHQALSQRTKRLENVTSKLRNLSKLWVLPESVSTFFPEHGKYFFFYFDDIPFGEGRELLNLFSRILQTYGLPVRAIASFGFDEVVVTSYRDDEQEGPGIIRVSPGDGPQRDILIHKAISYFFEILPRYLELNQNTFEEHHV